MAALNPGGLQFTDESTRVAHFIGIDIGTSGVKALLVDEAGRVVAAASRSYPLYTPQPGWAEQDPEDWMQATVASIGDLLRQAGRSIPVRALSFSGQMHGAVLIDSRGEVVRPAILWCDVRTQPECEEITAAVGRDELLRRTGNPALAGFTAPKLVWLRKHEPQNLDRAATLLLPKDYVRYRLTGEMAMDLSDAAGTLLLDVGRGRWDTGLAELLGLRPSLLPPLVASHEVAGRLTAEAAAATGLPAGIPVVAGGADNACGAVGAGVVQAGQGLVSIGSSGVVLVQSDRFRIDPGGRIHSFSHAVPNAWYLMGVMLSAGLSYAWLRDQVVRGGQSRPGAPGMPGAPGLPGEPDGQEATGGQATVYELMDAEAARVRPGSDGLFFLPYLNGERTPHADPFARGGWIGLAFGHTRAHLVRAVMEGVAYGLRDSLELIRPLVSGDGTAGGTESKGATGDVGSGIGPLRAIGGGAKSPVWRQILADVLGMPLEIPAVDEGPAYGAALLAAVGAGAFPGVAEAARACVRVKSTVEPNAAHRACYDEGYAVYRRLYPALAQIFPAMVNLAR